jgi:WD40 repeat protein
VTRTGKNQTVSRLRVSDGKFLGKLQMAKDRISAIAFSPVGTLLATGSPDASIALWRADSGTVVKEFFGLDSISGLAFSPDGFIIASSSNDKRLNLWQTSDGALLHTLEGFLPIEEDSLSGAAFSPDGATFVSGSSYGLIRWWGVSDKDWTIIFRI